MAHSFKHHDELIPILVRKHAKSRRMVLRYVPRTHAISLTLPRYVSLRQGLSFVETKRDWLAAQMQRRRQGVPFSEGQVIPLLGKEYRIVHAPGRGVVRISEDELLVPGDAQFMARRVRDFVIAQARAEITRLAHIYAKQLATKPIRKITLRDTGSHWGSCNNSGNLSFSWRLAFAPYEVLDYVVCHEVAHLLHLNHSEKFWKCVAQICPDFTTHRAWLKRHGDTLYFYGK